MPPVSEAFDGDETAAFAAEVVELSAPRKRSLRELLNSGDLDAGRVAIAVGVNRTTVWRWASGRSRPKAAIASQLVERYGPTHGLSFDSIFGDPSGGT